MSPPATVDFKPINIANWPQHLSQKLNQFLDKESHFDLELIFGSGERLGAHSLVLLASTDFFVKEMCKQDNGKQIQMPDSLNHSDFILMLRFMYTGKILVTKKNFQSLLAAAQTIDLKCLLSRLEPYRGEFEQSTPFRFEATKRRTDSPEEPTPPTKVARSENSPRDRITPPHTVTPPAPPMHSSRLTTAKVLEKYRDNCPQEPPKHSSLTQKVTTLITNLLKSDPGLFQREPEIKLRLIQRNEVTKTDQIRYATVKYTTTDGKNQLRIHLDPILDPVSPQGPWSCYRCFKEDRSKLSFSSYYGCRYHYETVHKIKFNPLTCPQCGSNFKKKINFVYHKLMKHGIPPMRQFSFPKCQECPFFALDLKNLEQHVQEVHGPASLELNAHAIEDEGHITFNLDHDEPRAVSKVNNSYGFEDIMNQHPLCADDEVIPLNNSNDDFVPYNELPVPEPIEFLNFAVPVNPDTNLCDLTGNRSMFLFGSSQPMIDQQQLFNPQHLQQQQQQLQHQQHSQQQQQTCAMTNIFM